MNKKVIPLLIAAAFCVASASAQAQLSWQPFKSAKGKFSVSMPCKPAIEVEPKTADGPEITFYSCELASGAFIVSHADFDVAVSGSELLDAFVTGTVSGSTLVSQKNIMMGAMHGRDLILSSHKDGVTTIGKWRVYQNGKRIY